MLDHKGNGICQALSSLGYESVKNANVGKVITLEMVGEDKEKVYKEVEAMCESLLANVVIEDYKIKM